MARANCVYLTIKVYLQECVCIKLKHTQIILYSSQWSMDYTPNFSLGFHILQIDYLCVIDNLIARECSIFVLHVPKHNLKVLHAFRIQSRGIFATKSFFHNSCLPLLNLEDSALYGVCNLYPRIEDESISEAEMRSLQQNASHRQFFLGQSCEHGQWLQRIVSKWRRWA